MSPKRVLIYRLGSLGDTIVALPCFHLIAARFPGAERRVLTGFPVNAAKESPIATILNGTDLAHGYMRYPVGTRDVQNLFQLASEIRAWKPDVLINICPARGIARAIRDWAFFRLCGIRRMIGFAPQAHRQSTRVDPNTGLYQNEADRLLDRLKALNPREAGVSKSWDLALSAEETDKAIAALAPIEERPKIAVSMGAKFSAKDWGEENWHQLANRMALRFPEHGLMLVGSADEADRSHRASQVWRDRRVNLCGKMSPRESAAALAKAELFVGHDGGPMHLAASMGTRCVAIFSARDMPGRWYPNGDGHRLIYHQTDCFGCKLEKCTQHEMKCILSITVDEVIENIEIAYDGVQKDLTQKDLTG